MVVVFRDDTKQQNVDYPHDEWQGEAPAKGDTILLVGEGSSEPKLHLVFDRRWEPKNSYLNKKEYQLVIFVRPYGLEWCYDAALRFIRGW